MRKRLFIVVAATGALALPSVALAVQPTDTESNSQGSLVGQLNPETTGKSIPPPEGVTMGDVMQRVHEVEGQGSLSDHGNCKACEIDIPPR
jgi:hypothetical protein